MADLSFISYNPNTGLVVKTKAEIMDTLLNIAQQAYGGSYTVDKGTEMYNFLDIIASAITDAGNACQDVYNAFSFITAEGAPLDSLVSLAGISRIEGESDTQLRARYYRFLYTQSSGTMEGLTARIIESTTTQTDVEAHYIQDVRIYENYGTTTVQDYSIAWSPNGVYSIEDHSILVVIKLREDYIDAGYFTQESSEPYTQSIVQEDAQALNEIIENYKSLGCGLIENNTRVDADTTYYFAIALNSELTITINIYFPDRTNYVNYHAAVENYIKTSVQSYINGLQLGEDILYSGIMACVYQAYNELSVNDYIFTVGNGSDQQQNNDIVVTGKYIGTPGLATNDPQTINLNQTSPRVVVPYTAYIDIDDNEVNSRIIVNSTYPE